MPKKTHVVLLLDRSGSMDRNRDTTISAVNEYIGSLKKDKKILFTSVQFDDMSIDRIHNAVPIADVEEWTRETFKPRGNTPLYDAIGRVIVATREKGKKRVLFLIMTDGEENASLEWDQKKVFGLITKMQEKGWTFVYMGANQDAYAVGYGLGVPKLNTQCYAAGEEADLMAKVSRATVTYTGGGSVASDRFFEDG